MRYHLFSQLARLKNIQRLLETLIYNEELALKNSDFPEWYYDLGLDCMFDMRKEVDATNGNEFWMYDEFFFDFPADLNQKMKRFVFSYSAYNDKALLLYDKPNYWEKLKNLKEWESLCQNANKTLPGFQIYISDLIKIVE